MGSGPGRIVGIDLGTTHTLVAHASVADGEIAVLDVPQLVAPGQREARPLLPSCLYAPAPGEATDGDGPWLLGELARRRGAEVPGRVVVSSKSWLAHPGVDRSAAILPWGADDDVPHLSPVDAATLLLARVRQAYDDMFPGAPLAQTDAVLTVPASFDEVARELTLQAAARAGLNVRLLEEPQAAFYAWMRRAGRVEVERLLTRAGGERARVLVCDVGGGTTDLSLIELVHAAGAHPAVNRVAVGHHLLLGGDNMDLALALRCEERLRGGEKLDAARFGQLVTACRAAKEVLLGGDDAPVSVPVTLLGAGSRLVGGTLSTTLAREEVETLVLEGFFPAVDATARPERARSALVAFGLPYERDVAITRHVAAFLARHAPGAAVHAVLLNGGVFASPRVVQRLAASLRAFAPEGQPLEVLDQRDPSLGVAKGAVAYALARRGMGVRIGGGSARGYYVVVEGGEAITRRAVCVVPRGAGEGVAHVAAGRTFEIVVGRPVRFEALTSDDAAVDRAGDLVELDSARAFTPLPPLTTVLDATGTSKRGTVRVQLEGELTPLGTLDLACTEATPGGTAGSARRYRLAFQLREAQPTRASVVPLSVGRPTPPPPSVATRGLEPARALIDAAFQDDSGRGIKDLLRDLERQLGERATWGAALARGIFDAVSPHARARRKSPDHERVFWLLAGYCIRPGFGAAGDELRVARLATLLPERVAAGDSARVWQQFFIACRRLAGGLEEGPQVALRDTYDPFVAPGEAGLKKSKKFRPQSEADLLEAVASLERVPATRRADLGGWILERTWTDRDPRLWAAIGRLGARVPAYASVHHVIPSTTAERWLEHLLREKWDQMPTAPLAAAQMARRTGDRARDVGDRVRTEVERRLVASGAREDWVRGVREVVTSSTDAEQSAFLGEDLPVGLVLVG